MAAHLACGLRQTCRAARSLTDVCWRRLLDHPAQLGADGLAALFSTLRAQSSLGPLRLACRATRAFVDANTHCLDLRLHGTQPLRPGGWAALLARCGGAAEVRVRADPSGYCRQRKAAVREPGCMLGVAFGEFPTPATARVRTLEVDIHRGRYVESGGWTTAGAAAGGGGDGDVNGGGGGGRVWWNPATALYESASSGEADPGLNTRRRRPLPRPAAAAVAAAAAGAGGRPTVSSSKASHVQYTSLLAFPHLVHVALCGEWACPPEEPAARAVGAVLGSLPHLRSLRLGRFSAAMLQQLAAGAAGIDIDSSGGERGSGGSGSAHHCRVDCVELRLMPPPSAAAAAGELAAAAAAAAAHAAATTEAIGQVAALLAAPRALHISAPLVASPGQILEPLLALDRGVAEAVRELVMTHAPALSPALVPQLMAALPGLEALVVGRGCRQLWHNSHCYELVAGLAVAAAATEATEAAAKRPVGLVTGRGAELLVWSAGPDAEQQPVSDGRGGGGVPAHLHSLPGAALAAVTAAAAAATDDPCAVQRACEAAAAAAEAIPWVAGTPELWVFGPQTWSALAFDTDREVLYGATRTEVYCAAAAGGRSSVSRFDSPARRTSLLGAAFIGSSGGGSHGIAAVQQAAASPGQGPFTGIRCLLPLPGGAGLLVGDGPHLRRIDPDGAVRTLLPHALRSTAAADGSGCGSGGGPCPLTSLAFVPGGGGAGGGTVVAASAGCPRLLMCSAEELSLSYGHLEAVAALQRQAATAVAYSGRLMSALRQQASNNDVTAAADSTAGAVAAAAQNAAAVVTIRVCAAGSNRCEEADCGGGSGGGSGGGGGGDGAPSAAACFVAHRAVLSSHSDFFKQLLALEPPSRGGGGGGGSSGGGGDGSSFAEGGAAQVELREADPDVFARLLAYMYTGKQCALGEDLDLLQPAQLKAVAELAGRLLLPGAITLLQPRLLAAAATAPETAVAELVWAASHSLTGLVEELSGFVVAHAVSVLPATPQEALAALAAAQPELMAAIMQAIAVAVAAPV
eukprot:XP_001692281.1 predicted protein [Chlamydomonas reinhardtii]